MCKEYTFNRKYVYSLHNKKKFFCFFLPFFFLPKNVLEKKPYERLNLLEFSTYATPIKMKIVAELNNENENGIPNAITQHRLTAF